MVKKTVWLIFLFFFPLICFVVSFCDDYSRCEALVIQNYKQTEIMTLTKENQCVTKYSINEEGKVHNTYVIETRLSQKYHYLNPPAFLFNKGVFLQYDIDLNLTDVTADMSFNNETKEMTVVHNIDESVITIKKTKMHGIIIKYINKSESEHD